MSQGTNQAVAHPDFSAIKQTFSTITGLPQHYLSHYPFAFVYLGGERH